MQMRYLDIGRRISADSRISHWIVDLLSGSRIWICYYPKIIGYQNRISDTTKGGYRLLEKVWMMMMIAASLMWAGAAEKPE